MSQFEMDYSIICIKHKKKMSFARMGESNATAGRSLRKMA